MQKVVPGPLNPLPVAMKLLTAIANCPKPFSIDSGGVEAVAGGGGDGGDLGPFRTHGGVPKTALPAVLQPRVVVYDGVCHLCHRAALSLWICQCAIESCNFISVNLMWFCRNGHVSVALDLMGLLWIHQKLPWTIDFLEILHISDDFVEVLQLSNF